MPGATARTTRAAPSFVGRHAEAALVALALEQTLGVATALVIRGEPGIGKTRLLNEVTTRARSKGHQVLVVRANAHEARVPFGALSLALERAAAQDAAFTAGADAVRSFIADPGQADARLSFAQICDAFARMLIEAGDRTPTALAIDDLHALDHESLALLGVVLGRIAERNISFVCTTRSPGREVDDNAAELLSRLADWPEVEELHLGPLTEDLVQAVLEDVFGKPVNRSVAEVVSRHSGGNPLFVLEMANSLSELDRLDVAALGVAFQGGPGDLHLTRHTAVLQRLFPLSPACRRVAQVVAVLHRVRAADLGMLAALIRLDPADVAEAFDELERRGIVVDDGEQVWMLFHPFVADALYDDIGPAERRRIHQVVAEHLADRRLRGDAVDLSRLAWHVAESADVGDLVAAGVLRDAAEAIKATGPLSAAELCQKALRLVPDDDPLCTEVLALRARCLILAGRPSEAVEAGLAALHRLPPGEERTRVANAVIGALFDAGKVDEARHLAEREVGSGTTSPFLLSQHAMLVAGTGDASLASAAMVAANAHPPRSPAEAVLVHSFLSAAAGIAGTMADAVARWEQLHAAALEARSTMTVYGLTRRAWSIVSVGFVTLGMVATDEAEAVLGDIGPGTYSAGVVAARFGLSWMRGEWEDALGALSSSKRDIHSSASVQRYLQCVEIDICTAKGQLHEALALVNQPISGGSATMATWATAGALAATGDDDGARSLLRATIERPTDQVWMPQAVARLVELEVRRGDRRAAAEALERLEHIVETDHDPRPWARALMFRARALVHEDAQAAMSSVVIAQREGLAHETALSQLVAGSLDLTCTDALLAAHETFTALGAEADRRRTAALLRERGAKVPRRKRTTHGQLTTAEAQIARLVQTGIRNRDIARATNYSERTVEVYLSRIYAKLGVSSRLQLARLLDEHGMPDDDQHAGD